jgi:hypothetical protein
MTAKRLPSGDGRAACMPRGNRTTVEGTDAALVFSKGKMASWRTWFTE